jgi:hypothetical protein
MFGQKDSTNHSFSFSTIFGDTVTDRMVLTPSGDMSVSSSVSTGSIYSSNITSTNIVSTNISSGTLNATSITSSSLLATGSARLINTSNTLGNIITNSGYIGINTVVPLARLHLSHNGDTYGNILFEPGYTSDGGNAGISTMNFNGYYAGGEQRINTSKNRWRLVADQRSSDTFSLDTIGTGIGLTTVFSVTSNGNMTIPTLSSTNLVVTNVSTGTLQASSSTIPNLVSTNISSGTLRTTDLSVTNTISRSKSTFYAVGPLTLYMPEIGSMYKKVILYNKDPTVGAVNGGLTFPTAFTVTPGIISSPSPTSFVQSTTGGVITNYATIGNYQLVLAWNTTSISIGNNVAEPTAFTLVNFEGY